jgi:hypothetical protein
VTTTSLTRKLRKELDALHTRIAKLEEQANNIRATISYLEEKDSGTASSVVLKQMRKSSPEPTPAPESETSILIKEMKEILETHGRPMHRKAIYEALAERGINIKGLKPINNVSAHLSLGRSIFKSVGEGYWTLRAWENDSKAERDLSLS